MQEVVDIEQIQREHGEPDLTLTPEGDIDAETRRRERIAWEYRCYLGDFPGGCLVVGRYDNGWFKNPPPHWLMTQMIMRQRFTQSMMKFYRTLSVEQLGEDQVEQMKEERLGISRQLF